MPTGRNDEFDALFRAHLQTYSTGVNRNDSMLTDAALAELLYTIYGATPFIVPESAFYSPSISFEIATEEPPEEVVPENSEELDNFLKEFALKEVC